MPREIAAMKENKNRKKGKLKHLNTTRCFDYVNVMYIFSFICIAAYEKNIKCDYGCAVCSKIFFCSFSKDEVISERRKNGDDWYFVNNEFS